MEAEPETKQIFLSYSGEDECEAGLLQFALETLLASNAIYVWTYKRDQLACTRSIGLSIKEQVKKSTALIFIASPNTVKGGATQWMELGYADAFNIQTYVLLHRITYAKLKMKERGAAPFLTEGQCSPLSSWRQIADELLIFLNQNQK
jgi:hypothetical protein